MWEDISFILSSPICYNILKAVTSEKTPSQISREINVARSNISTKLSELLKRKLIVCLNPNSRRWRFYKISDKGKSVLKRVDEVAIS